METDAQVICFELDAREAYPFEPTPEDWADYEAYIDEQEENWIE